MKKKSAFSLIELSVVIVIIGIIIAGISQSSRLITEFKVSSARTQTESGPVLSIKNLSYWYEATLDSSFINSEEDDGIPITAWYDNGITMPKKDARRDIVNQKPTFKTKCINSLPCLRFDGGDSMIFDSSALIGTDYTIFIVDKRALRASASPIIGSSSSMSANQAIDIGYVKVLKDATTIKFSHGSSSNLYYFEISKPVSTWLQTFLFSSLDATNGPFFHYINGVQSNISSGAIGTPRTSMKQLTAFPNALLGGGFTVAPSSGSAFYLGDIGEIIIYSRALNKEERSSVEAYLIKKWDIK